MKQSSLFAALLFISAQAVGNTDPELQVPSAMPLKKLDSENWKSVTEALKTDATYNNSTVQIHSCESLYKLPAATSDDGNISWGGICTDAASKEQAFICTDRMMGRFTVLPDFKNNPDWIAQAIFDNCSSGQALPKQ